MRPPADDHDGQASSDSDESDDRVRELAQAFADRHKDIAPTVGTMTQDPFEASDVVPETLLNPRGAESERQARFAQAAADVARKSAELNRRLARGPES